ncbi:MULTISPECIES: peptidase domain-containing ABC transporter [Burkholderia]|uniref:peptidase domain-containing ABC transporter n=1 Tax=Burkholderia TaxID=32008 RepID=UPI00084198FC|nr:MULTISPECIES: peptidase domain-containing ABC transporter [unclassified Burkholderia]
MSLLDRLSFGVGHKLPMLLQTESAECGLACLAMVAGFHGHHVDLATMRSRFPVSLKGAGLGRVIDIAQRLDLGTRALKLDLDQLSQLRTPCILHWNFNHFVVLKEVNGKSVTIHDPAQGVRKLSFDEVSRAFTGVALELWPTGSFKPLDAKPSVKLRSLLGPVAGLSRSLGQIFLLAIALEIFTLVSPFFLQWVIDEVIVSADRDLLTVLALGFGLLLLMQQATSAIRAWALMYFGTTLNVQWRANVFTHLLSLPVKYFERRHLGDVVSRFGSIDTIQQTMTSSFLSAVIDGLMTIVTLAMMFVYSRTLAFVSLGTMLLYALMRWLWYRPLRLATEDQIIHTAKQQSHFLETVRGVKTIKLFNRQSERRSSWLTLLVEQVNAGLHVQKLQLLYQQINGLLFGIENLLIIWLGARLVMDGQFTVGVLMAFNAYKGQFDSRVGSLIDKFFEIKMLQLQGERLADIVFAQAETDTSLRHVPGEAENLEASIEAENLTFQYAEGEPVVLNGVSLKIPPGESVALVGPSGCGKTTLVNVLLGILEPTGGKIKIGGVDVERLGIDRLRTLVGTVLQDDVLFAGSIADNISFFDPNADPNWVAQCAQLAAVHADIVAMPMGYNTLVGDMGTVLSGGQKQRVLLARALYKRPKILVLDEATSHLDVQRERLVNAAVSALNMTRLIVAHRPETIATAQRVIMLDGGKVALDQSTAALAEMQKKAAQQAQEQAQQAAAAQAGQAAGQPAPAQQPAGQAGAPQAQPAPAAAQPAADPHAPAEPNASQQTTIGR